MIVDYPKCNLLFLGITRRTGRNPVFDMRIYMDQRDVEDHTENHIRSPHLAMTNAREDRHIVIDPKNLSHEKKTAVNHNVVHKGLNPDGPSTTVIFQWCSTQL
ncbi:hypothetical protein TNCV_2201541 [Trichonephila clavipes]|nr:hypothetical protein TNCV_2201541 [Trichonephila clavipes]